MVSSCFYRYDKAKDVLKKSIAVKDTPHARWLLGDALCELGHLEQAEPHFLAVQTDAATLFERTHALQQLLHVYRKTGEVEKATNCSRQLAALQ